jgi:aminoglycoside 6-adenylyltransferase
LFKDGVRIDLFIEIKEEAVKNVLDDKLMIILLDKDNFLPIIPLPSDEDFYVKKPDENKYIACCNEFWWCLNNVAKGIARDELPYAMEMFNSIVRDMLNKMTDWYIGIQTDFAVSTGKMKKYYKKYLPEGIYNLYTNTYSNSDYDNIWASVFSACELFRTLAMVVANYFGYTYNKQEDENMTSYLVNIRHECSDINAL